MTITPSSIAADGYRAAIAEIERPGANWHYNYMKAHADRLLIPPQALHFDDGRSELNPEPIFDWRAIYGHAPAPPGVGQVK